MEKAVLCLVAEIQIGIHIDIYNTFYSVLSTNDTIKGKWPNSTSAVNKKNLEVARVLYYKGVYCFLHNF